MSIIAGMAEDLHVFQEMTWANVDRLIDAFINQYGFPPQEIRVSEVGQRKLEVDLPRLGLEPVLLSKLAQYRGVTVKTQKAFSHDTIELTAILKEQPDLSAIDAAFVDLVLAFLQQVLHTPLPVREAIKRMEITEMRELRMQGNWNPFRSQEWAVTVTLQTAIPRIGDTLLLAVDNRSGTYAINRLYFQPGWKPQEEQE